MAKTVLKSADNVAEEMIKTEFHVIFSISYEVPVLYFIVTRQGMNDSNKFLFFLVYWTFGSSPRRIITAY